MNSNKSNLLKFFIFFLLSITFCSCYITTDEDCDIPYTYVSGTIYLNYYSELNSVGNAVYFDEIGTSTGYNDHGFIVVRTSTSEFAVFDASCTYDYSLDDCLEIVGTYVQCPNCDSKFSILTGGWPFDDSDASCCLQEYSCTYSSSKNTLTVYN
jgi:nitrite reductase/ring-hydroxylating ferredoxin subunit